ncbi:MAG: riboflavin synthase [bacterium (Candidatus Ratteibacteria) CG_4_10_14_3_um_filter_41_18]|uniref:Riboflavin synthase n=4 Tax=Candidatus Ratteibacteria TaxID=2979319 RepID=A0A2M7E9N8_9BACT|nr:MAG: riboflavin synthase subunit alpha [Candidatus Omnitrophica bacterium CG1_02_41_171]PIV64443.1 MAG: riboflavin synthase [bacterium (Candidatus Ratteibacteria) CG01_land_8_20_14_3_00_40_19]PIW33686.1 MAG: riboflavin synthase [bacterium (Candidatus Ratteibacteria) CG15_BIG_FIL_POST_REV_8_21_14_020_41_12]PIW74034.1 MAG: riboflavin synthase [bacterium (Candidatus Ratteibacteria) CG_4_8_14_3_um_filter_41_36]PIX77291.1 MAG: riboflavin synthase [bacterium (Candidatus Ratteibacteria) CG_4_10_14_
MFTGLIEEIGKVEFREQKGNILILGIQGEKIITRAKAGDSVCVDGACLTIKALKNKLLYFDLMVETVKVSTLGELKIGSNVNLECALKVEERFGGHFVTGHIDGRGKIIEIIFTGDSKGIRIAVPLDFTDYIVSKGSIAVDGISLTVIKVGSDYFTVSLIPYTIKYTTLGTKKEGDRVNIELDILAKYVAKSNIKKEQKENYLKNLLNENK